VAGAFGRSGAGPTSPYTYIQFDRIKLNGPRLSDRRELDIADRESDGCAPGRAFSVAAGGSTTGERYLDLKHSNRRGCAKLSSRGEQQAEECEFR